MMKSLDVVRFYWLLLRCELKCCSNNFNLEVEERDARGKGVWPKDLTQISGSFKYKNKDLNHLVI